VAVDVFEHKLFICDIKGHQVHVLDKTTGETLYKIGKPGSKEGELFHPSNIYIQKDRLYVSETTNFRVQIFGLEGDFIARFGRIGDRPGEFARNKGVAVDKEERIYVVDAAFENVQVFNREFQLLLFMFGRGYDEGNINLPAGITIDYDHIQYFKKYLSPKFEAEYLLFVTSNYGPNKINVYAFGNYKNRQ
jgi:DNA-binding beta-propeller fold protein YncE